MLLQPKGRKGLDIHRNRSVGLSIETAEQLSIKTVEVWKSLDHRIINILEDESHTLQKTEGRNGLAIHRHRSVALYKNRRSVKKPEPESKDIRGNERKKTIWN